VTSAVTRWLRDYPRFLNIYVAPDNYTLSPLQAIPLAHIKIITIPIEHCRPSTLLPFRNNDPCIGIKSIETTLLTIDFGIDLVQISSKYPDATKLRADTYFVRLVVLQKHIRPARPTVMTSNFIEADLRDEAIEVWWYISHLLT
jgi:hypothetical protein